MDEKDFRATLTKEELEKRAFIVPFKVVDFELLERLNHYSNELERTFDELINVAVKKLLDDIRLVHSLRRG
jgi:hypothetical protein